MPLSLQEYARAIGKHPQTIRKWCRLGKVKAKKNKGGKDWLIYDDPKEF